jgi:Nif-specific regulatory protein
MRQVFERVKPLSADRDISILIYGETGTGKEMFAKAIHQNSPRSDQPFVAVNCGAIPEHLLESELFGHEKGAFTDAKNTKTGLFETANGGTLLLDEIDSMPVNVQVKLLRVLEEREIRRVGGTTELPLDIRLIAAANRRLEEMVSTGQFRKDLFFRIAVAPVQLPPLRKRGGDIRLLIGYFLEKYNREKNKKISFSNEVYSVLETYDWPGNVRELENMVEMLVVTNPDGHLEESALPVISKSNDFDPFSASTDIKQATKSVVENFEKDFLLRHLESNRWNISKTAEEIGLSRAALHSKLKQYKLQQ